MLRLSLLPFSSFGCNAHLSSTAVCKGNAFIRRLESRPRPPTPKRTSQTTLRLAAKACRTSVRSGSGRLEMVGMVAYAMTVPSGNCAVKAAGKCFGSWFWRTVPPIVTPQTFSYVSEFLQTRRTCRRTIAKLRRNMKNAIARPFCETWTRRPVRRHTSKMGIVEDLRGASTGK